MATLTELTSVMIPTTTTTTPTITTVVIESSLTTTTDVSTTTSSSYVQVFVLLPTTLETNREIPSDWHLTIEFLFIFYP